MNQKGGSGCYSDYWQTHSWGNNTTASGWQWNNEMTATTTKRNWYSISFHRKNALIMVPMSEPLHANEVRAKLWGHCPWGGARCGLSNSNFFANVGQDWHRLAWQKIPGHDDLRMFGTKRERRPTSHCASHCFVSVNRPWLPPDRNCCFTQTNHLSQYFGRRGGGVNQGRESCKEPNGDETHPQSVNGPDSLSVDAAEKFWQNKWCTRKQQIFRS